MTVLTDTGTLPLTLWRDHDQRLLDEPGVPMGTRAVDGDPARLAAGLYREGVRRVGLDRPVDLTGGMEEATLVRAMVLLRELTGWGVVVAWRLLPGPYTEIWQRLNHLYPPAELVGRPESGEIVRAWRSTFYLCKCVYRHGPGFVEVRDRRSGSLARFVIDDPAYLAVVERLVDGAPARELDPEVLGDLVTEGLAGLIGDLAWWLPYRCAAGPGRRWSSEALSRQTVQTVKTILPTTSPSTMRAKPSRASASGSTLSIAGRTPATTQNRSSPASSSRVPMVEPTMVSWWKKTRVSAARGFGPVVAPEMTIVPCSLTDATECSHVAAPTVSITASTRSGRRAPDS
jgi:hypothetical protein